MIKMLGLSRARFYQLVEQGVFPQPIYDLRSKRPMYDLALQQVCLTVRETNVGFNGQYVLFYSPRKNTAAAKSPKKSEPPDEPISELTETLKRMGLDVTAAQVSSAVESIFPEGLDKTDSGVVIRDLFRYFKSKGSE